MHGARTRSFAVAAGALGLVAVAVVAGAPQSDGAAHHLRLPAVAMLVLVAVAVGTGLSLVVVVMSLRGGQLGALPRRTFLSQLLGIFGAIVFFGAVALLVRHLESGFVAAHKDAVTAGGGPEGDPSVRAPTTTADAVGSVLGVLVLGLGIVLLVGRRLDRRPAPAATVSAARDVSDVLDDAIADLRSDTDSRRAVIAAYDRMERSLERHGLGRRPAEAPGEYVARVLPALDASGPSIVGLTQLFERAMFSTHPIDAAMQASAVDALITLRDELRAGRPDGAVAGVPA
jgi:hypothetical protein